MSRRIAIVTGVGRLKGIGRAICLELASRNIDVFFTYWNEYDDQMPWKVGPDEPEEVRQEILSSGVKCQKLELDLSLPESGKKLFDAAEKAFGEVVILVNNATYSTQTSINDISSSELDAHYRVNLRATTLLIKEFVGRFQGTDGRIISLTSGQSLGQMDTEIAYAMTKGAVETLTFTLSKPLASKGITINAVNPGPTDTGWMDHRLEEELLKRFPMKRIGLPKDAANLIGFLASKEAGWITGQVIHSEGGFIR